ncbi:mucin-2-like isoform X2 [Acanthaster planci]|nr:mucin-2-like isoform X2 [Acanthaster planci]
MTTPTTPPIITNGTAITTPSPSGPTGSVTPTTRATNATTPAPTSPAATTPSAANMTTKPEVVTTPMTGNTTGNTTGPTNITITTVAPAPVVPRFQVNNSDGETCMLLNFNAMMMVNYTTKDKGVQTATIPIMNATSYEGFCNSTMPRTFTLYYPDNDSFCASLTLLFNATSNATYYNAEAISVRYVEPCFPSNASKYNGTDQIKYSPSYNGTIGKSFQCQKISPVSKNRSFALVLDDVFLQPFAERSADPGRFGEVESCRDVPSTPKPTATSGPSHPPTKPSPSHAGEIAGIVLGLLAAVLIVGFVVYMVRKRRYKPISYGNLDEEITRAI